MISNYWFPSLPVFPQSKYSGISLPSPDTENVAPELFDLQGRRVNRATARPGIYIERRGTTSRKIIL